MDLFGEEHIEISNTYFKISLIKIHFKDESAIDYIFKSLNIRRNLLGEDNVETADAYIRVGNLYNVSKNFLKAKRVLFNRFGN